MYEDPVPLVVEVWCPSTGDYDVDKKLDEYRRRGDPEIWRIHPYERILIAWSRQAGGSYAEQMYAGGTIRPAAFPDAVIEFDKLLA